MSPRRRALVIVAAVALPLAIVAGLVALIAGWIVAVVVFFVVGVAAAAAVWFGCEARVRSQIGGRAPDPTRRAEARLVNLVEGLCMASGLHQPELRVIDDPGINALAAGRAPNRAVLAVTTGLLEDLTRIELEAVLAAELVHIRQDEILPATVAAATFGLGARLAAAGDDEVRSDQAAVSLTRYPPGLTAALEKMVARGTALRDAPPVLEHLWFADPATRAGVGSADASGRRRSLDQRIEALSEL